MRSRAVRHALWGALLGLWLGVLDGALSLPESGFFDRAIGLLVAMALYAVVLAALGIAVAGVRSFRSRAKEPGTASGGLPPLAIRAAAGSVAFALAIAAIGARGTTAPGDDPRPNLILVSIDTLRADHVGAYGYSQPTTPALDALAAEGVLFENAHSSSSWTLPAHATLLTGLDPFTHGLTGSGQPLPEAIDTLAERLRAEGYATAAWVGTTPFGYVGAAFGLGAGFESYEHYPHPRRSLRSGIGRLLDIVLLQEVDRGVGNASAEIDSVIDWLTGAGERPFFLFVHLYDVHSKMVALPYEAPEPFRDRLCPGAADAFEGCQDGVCASERMRAMVVGALPAFGADELEPLRCLYDGGVAYTDQEIGRLLSFLDASPLGDSTAVVVTSDHGEAFFEHGMPLHVTLHEEVTRIPLLMRLPDGPSGVRVPNLVGLVDVAPTLLELAGVEIGDEIQGRSLLPLVREEKSGPDPGVVAVSLQDAMLRTKERKYIVPGRPDSGASPSLYALDEDPKEQTNRSHWDSRGKQELAEALEARRRAGVELRKRLLADAQPEPVVLGDAERDALRALGYAVDSENGAPPGSEPKPQAAPDAPNVLLITVDTLRADRLGAYGYELDTSPKLDALAARGARFASATVQWPKTWPSLASFLTGTHPRTTGIGAVPRVLPGSLRMLAEIFGDAGYATAAVVSNVNAGRQAGFGQGFESFVESWEETWREQGGAGQFVNAPGKVKEYTNARLVTGQALRWLWGRGDDERPFFLWVHYMDPHGPYKPPAEYRELFAGHHESESIPLNLLPAYQQQRRGGEVITDLAFYQAQYDREIRYFDDELGRLLEAVGWTAGERLVTLLTADHGESLGEHDYYLEHGALSYQPTAAVPALIAGPEVAPGQVIETPVGLVDLSATLLELSGISVPENFEGTSLAPLLRGEPEAAEPRYVFMQSGGIPNAPQLTVRDGHWKLIQVRFEPERRMMAGAEYELYDLRQDPGELVNVADSNPELVARLSAVLSEWYAARPEPLHDGEALDIEELDAGTRKLLEALGYLEPGVQP